MGKKILFSPVGNTDPIRYNKDGSMLHICRVYKPDVVYLYLSQEMAESQKKDGRYTTALRFLGEKTGHKFCVKLWKDTQMTEAQNFDIFYQKFQRAIDSIEKDMEEGDQLLLNISSGTPGMKSALMVMSTLESYRFQPIQVNSPKKRSNLEYEDRDVYDIEEQWKNNEDNDESFDNRCREVQSPNLLRKLKIDVIKKHLLAYDYHAAYEVADGMEKDLSVEILRMLHVAKKRISMDWNSILPEENRELESFMPIKDGDRKKLFEYALVLKIKYQKGEYADFIRGITPLGIDLMKMASWKYCRVDIDSYCSEGKWSKEKLKGSEVLKILNEEYHGAFRYDVVYSSQIYKIIQRKCTDQSVKKLIRDFTEIERKVRNMAAHEIVSVTDEWIKQRVKKDAAGILKTIQEFCEAVDIVSDKNQWNSYDLMNQKIIESLK